MDDALLMRCFEGFGDLLGDGEGFIERDRTLFDPICQGWDMIVVPVSCISEMISGPATCSTYVTGTPAANGTMNPQVNSSA